jgi:hypothetical protein
MPNTSSEFGMAAAPGPSGDLRFVDLLSEIISLEADAAYSGNPSLAGGHSTTSVVHMPKVSVRFNC